MRHLRLQCILERAGLISGKDEARGVSDADLLERFLLQRDEVAFELLVRRHERLVWGVCRRVLRREQDAEDAFQATFLVFVRSARSIKKSASVAGWLHRVAYRVALRANAGLSRRVQREAPGVDLSALPADDD